MVKQILVVQETLSHTNEAKQTKEAWEGEGGVGGGVKKKRKKEQRKIKRKRQRLDTRMVLSVISDCLVCNFVRARPK